MVVVFFSYNRLYLCNHTANSDFGRIWCIKNSRISILYNSNLTNSLSLSVAEMFSYLFQNVKLFNIFTQHFVPWNVDVVFWFALNPVNLCSLDVSSFLNNFDPFFRVCFVYIIPTIVSHHTLTFSAFRWNVYDVQYSKEIHPFLLYFKMPE